VGWTIVRLNLTMRHLRFSKAAFSRFRKEVEFESGKVLLSRLGNKIHATSAWCTHAGASLSQGILAADGRVVW